MPLDMFQQTQSDTDAYVAQNNSPRLPVEFGEGFQKAWDENRLFGQSIATFNAHQDALGDYLDEVHQKTGVLISPLNQMGDPKSLDEVGFDVGELRKKRPDLDLPDLTSDDIDRRAVAKSRAARTDYQNMTAAEKTAGGKFGSLLGGLAGAATDPVNLVAAPVAAPEGLGILGTALAWGGIAAATQATNEAIGSPYRDQVQPGYSQSPEPAQNILEAAGFGAATGGVLHGLGMAWTRAKTGAWPRSVRDAGNVVESEANVAQTNVLDGLDGEVAHRDALAKTVDDITAGRPADVGDIVTPDLMHDPEKVDALHESAATGQEPETAPAPEPQEPVVPTELEPATVAKDLDHEAPSQADAMLHDLDKQVAENDMQIPSGLDADGNVQYRSLKGWLDEVKADRESAAHLENCLTGADEEANAE